MAKKEVVSQLMCVIVLAGVQILPGANPDITDEDLAKLEKNKDFKALKKDARITVGEVVEDVAEAPAKDAGGKDNDGKLELTDMSNAKLKEICDTLGVEGYSTYNKAELIDAIEAKQAEDAE